MSFSNVVRADLDFFSRFLLSNKKYEKYISVRSAVVSEDEVMNFFSSVNLPVGRGGEQRSFDLILQR